MRALALLTPLVFGATLAAACSQPPRRDCFARVWVRSDLGEVRVVGSWDSWRRPGIEPEVFDADYKLARLELTPGEHAYLLEVGGELIADPLNPLTSWDGERVVSALDVPDCGEPRVAIEQVEVRDGTLRVMARFLASESGEGLDSVQARLRDGTPLAIDHRDRASGRIELSATVGPGKHRVRIRAQDGDGRAAEAEAVAWSRPRAPEWRDAIVYQILIDRFRGDGGMPLAPPPTPGSRAGGTLDGVRASLGELEALGVTTLWLSPVYKSPGEARAGNDGRMYEGYHGYWPVDSRAVDARIGGEAAFDALLEEAHARGMGVLLDVVPNHVYETNPRFVHGQAGWFHEPGCVCGTPECPWAGNIEHCWFTPYLPDVRWQHGDARRAIVDDVLFWSRRFDIDGMRVDAVPMMPRAATRWLAHAIRKQVQPRAAAFLLGEVFTGPGASGFSQLAYHLGPADLDSAFDFPLMWALADAIATGASGFEEVEALLALEQAELAGSAALLARMVDNHDLPRFISRAAGDGFGDPWDAPAAQPAEEEPYRRLELALAAILTLPGVPVLYQGDEIGLAGAGDPDNRRVMPADAELRAEQRELRAAVARLAHLRRCSEPLRRGEHGPLFADARRYAFTRGQGEVVVALSSASYPTEIELSIAPGGWIDAMSGDRFEGGEIRLPLEALSYRVLLAEGDPCAALGP